MRRVFFAIVAVAVVAELASCGGDPPPPTTVAFAGTLIRQRFKTDDAVVPIDGADVFVTNTAGGLLSQAKTLANGNFVAGGLPKQVPAALVFSKTPDYVRSVFTGDTESHDSLLFFGAVFEAAADDAHAILSEYSTAAGVSSNSLMVLDPAATTSTGGAMVRGRVVRLVETPQGLGYDTVKNATVTITDGFGTSYRVFYRGDFPTSGNDPGPIDPARTKTGSDSRFIAFGIKAQGISTLPFEAGPITVSVTTSAGTFTEHTLGVLEGITELDLFTVP